MSLPLLPLGQLGAPDIGGALEGHLNIEEAHDHRIVPYRRVPTAFHRPGHPDLTAALGDRPNLVALRQMEDDSIGVGQELPVVGETILRRAGEAGPVRTGIEKAVLEQYCSFSPRCRAAERHVIPFRSSR